MNERVIEIILYIMNEIRTQKNGMGELELLSKDLAERGYTDNEISSAFSWLFDKIKSNFEDLAVSSETTLSYSHRILNDFEKTVISPNAYGYLIQLRELNIIDALEMEQIIERAMMIGTSSVGLNDMKTIVASIMFHPDELMNRSYFLLDSSYQVH